MTAPRTSPGGMGSPRRSCGAPADTQSDAGIRSYPGDGAGTSSLHCGHGAGEQGKVAAFGQWLEPQDISDPYRKSREAFEYVFGLLGKASQEWARRLGQKGMKH